MSETAEPTYTHKATITIVSNGQDDEVQVRVVWDPDLDGEAIEALGFLPASYEFVQSYILPAIEKAYTDYTVDPMMQAACPSDKVN